MLYHVDSHNPHPDRGDSSISPVIGCIPCSQRYLLGSFSEKHGTLHNTELQVLLDQEFALHDSCRRLLHNVSNVPVLSVLKRHLSGDGSHRRLISSKRYDIQFGDISQHAYSCESVLIERLPAGVFADSFELQHLVHCGVVLDAAIFGDTNLELPSALSNRSILELHLDIGHGNLLEIQEGLELTSELPLHARYPPLDASGYWKVEIRPPEVVMLCKPKVSQHDCLSIIFGWNIRCEQIVWEVPCGNQAHSRIVSVVTITSALLSTLVIVYFVIFYSLMNNNAKES